MQRRSIVYPTFLQVFGTVAVRQLKNTVMFKLQSAKNELKLIIIIIIIIRFKSYEQ